MTKYLFYVRYALSGNRVYVVETDDFLHCVGYLHWTSLEEIKRVDVVLWTEEKQRFWENSGTPVYARNDLNEKKIINS